MAGILQQPYPQTDSVRRDWAAAMLSGAFVFGFLLVFQPFGINEFQGPRKVWYLAGYGMVTFVVLAFDLILVRRLFPRFFAESNWTVGRAIGWILFILLTAAVSNHAYSLAVGFGSFHFKGFAITLLTTFSVGIFPSVLIPLSNYIYHLHKYRVSAAPLQASVPVNARAEKHIPENSILENSQTQSLVELVADNGKDRMLMSLSDLFFIESSDNYSTVHFLKGGKLAKELIRGSLSRLETQITVPDVVRCHRSYIVNLAKVRSVSGNAQGYKLHLDGLETPVPVSRKYSELVVGRFK